MSDAIPVNRIKGVGEKTAALFGKINVYTVDDLIRHYPRDYETYDAPVSIRETSPGNVQAVYGQITAIPNVKKVRNLSILNAILKDDNGDSIQLTFFNMPFLKKVLKPGGFYLFRGLVQQRGTHKFMEQPRMFTWDEYIQKSGRLLPRYALTKGLTNQTVQKSVAQALEYYPPEKEYLPQVILQKYPMLSHREAVYALHFPESREEMLTARNRMVFEEFFSFLLVLRKNKELAAKTENHFPMYETADTVRFLEQLPFPLTKAQKKVWGELREDMGSPYAMNRLIQGDVGSGKTILAVLALLMCAANGYQGAMMAPTEVLAVQHFETISGYVKKYGIAFRPVLLTGSMTAKEKREAYAKIASGEANLIIGTHALIQEKVEYSSLALVVTDEQHRFGVRQRETLAAKGSEPHVLVMSATPIPRTLAIILYGDLKVSVIDELPANRLPIKNCVVGTSYRPKAYEFIAKEVAAGRQAYVICPMVEEGESEDMENVVDYTEKLRAVLPPSVQVAYLHGKMRPADKNRIMEEFAAKEIDVLVSTTVIEVGINVPNATVMMVENAERFGLAQLHQLRGRVGRGEFQSYCIFISTSDTKETMERLQILNHSNDGFHIASEDLKLRGPGDIFGIRQSGEFAFVLGDIYTDANILKEASDAVEQLLVSDPELTDDDNRALVNYFKEHTAVNVVDFRTI
ncbi:ATP-dependent DNA helicase RecG [Firmicutes bacterium AM59-13]|jgi:ATP-dependent DNA helicase RecG|nr:ATP-dependent DNA helicase RecG [Firmicutes bacterium AM59-13]